MRVTFSCSTYFKSKPRGWALLGLSWRCLISVVWSNACFIGFWRVVSLLFRCWRRLKSSWAKRANRQHAHKLPQNARKLPQNGCSLKSDKPLQHGLDMGGSMGVCWVTVALVEWMSTFWNEFFCSEGSFAVFHVGSGRCLAQVQRRGSFEPWVVWLSALPQFKDLHGSARTLVKQPAWVTWKLKKECSK